MGGLRRDVRHPLRPRRNRDEGSIYQRADELWVSDQRLDGRRHVAYVATCDELQTMIRQAGATYAIDPFEGR